VRPLETDCLRVPDTSTLISYLKTGENRTEESNTERGRRRAKSKEKWGFLWEFDGVKPRPSIFDQITAILSGHA